MHQNTTVPCWIHWFNWKLCIFAQHNRILTKSETTKFGPHIHKSTLNDHSWPVPLTSAVLPGKDNKYWQFQSCRGSTPGDTVSVVIIWGLQVVHLLKGFAGRHSRNPGCCDSNCKVTKCETIGSGYSPGEKLQIFIWHSSEGWLGKDVHSIARLGYSGSQFSTHCMLKVGPTGLSCIGPSCMWSKAVWSTVVLAWSLFFLLYKVIKDGIKKSLKCVSCRDSNIEAKHITLHVFHVCFWEQLHKIAYYVIWNCQLHVFLQDLVGIRQMLNRRLAHIIISKIICGVETG